MVSTTIVLKDDEGNFARAGPINFQLGFLGGLKPKKLIWPDQNLRDWV